MVTGVVITHHINQRFCRVIHHGWRIIKNVDRLAGELIHENQ